MKKQRNNDINDEIKHLFTNTTTSEFMKFLKQFNYIPDIKNPYKWFYIIITFICNKLKLELTRFDSLACIKSWSEYTTDNLQLIEFTRVHYKNDNLLYKLKEYDDKKLLKPDSIIKIPNNTFARLNTINKIVVRQFPITMELINSDIV